jgi:hypothetical protein
MGRYYGYYNTVWWVSTKERNAGLMRALHPAAPGVIQGNAERNGLS